LEDIYGDLDIELLLSPRFRTSDISIFLGKFNQDNNQPEVQTINSQTAGLALKKLNTPILILDSDNSDLNGAVINSNQLTSDRVPLPFSYVPLGSICQPISNHVKTFAGHTEGYWKDLQPQGKKFLVIKMENGNFVSNQGVTGEEIGSEQINGKFLILDGIKYKSNNANHRLVYMEV
jgi:hypothetical protein